MISLGKNILDSRSRAAGRMIDYGKENELFIIIPDAGKMKFDLSPAVHVETSGGCCKKSQFFKLKALGGKLIKEKNIKMVTAQDPFFAGLIGWMLAKKYKIIFEAQAHGDFYGSNYYKNLGLFWRWRLRLGIFVLRRADKVRAVGERVKESLKKLGIAENKIVIKPVAAKVEDIKNYSPKLNLHDKYPEYKNIFLVLGRLEAVKNISWLIDVFKEAAPDGLLLIVGNGAEGGFLKEKAARSGSKNNIKFESWTEDPFSYIKTADCVLFPSLSEGYGLVAMEAVAAGTPVIMNNVGVANYELRPSDKVKILPINDKQKWVEAILSI